jgi:hypothetical protein
MIDLTPYNLTSNQSTVYQSAITLWPTTVSKVARTIWLWRVLTYNTLEELIHLGLATKAIKWQSWWYTMNPPSSLLHKLLDKAKAFEVIMPHLESQINLNNTSFKVQHFSWFEWIKTLYNTIANSTTDLRAFLGVDHIDPEIKEYLYDTYLPKRLANWIHSRWFVTASEDDRYFANKKNVPQSQTRIVHHHLFKPECEIIIFWEQYVSLASLSSHEKAAILVTSKKIHDSLSSIFDRIWDITTPLD